MIKNYEAKMEYLLRHGGLSKLPHIELNLISTKNDLHHKMRRTKGNIKRYPKLIDSLINLEAIPHSIHIDHHGSCGKMSDLEAERYERFLERHPKIAKWVNNPVGNLF